MLKVDFRPQKDKIFDFSKNRDFEPSPQVLRTAHPTPPGCAPHFWWGGLCVSRENLEFEGAKSSFQKGLGSKSRFLEKSKISSF